MSIGKSLQYINQNISAVYSDEVIILQTYTRKDCQDLGISYDPWKHLCCDVQVRKTGLTLYDVKIEPHILPFAKDASGNILTDKNGDPIIDPSIVIVDGSDTTEFRQANPNAIVINTPKISSIAFISYFSDDSAFLVKYTNSDTCIIGQSNGARLVQTIENGSRVLRLENADQFIISFNNGSILNMITDQSTGETSFVLDINNSIKLNTKSNNYISLSDNLLDIGVTDSSKINIQSGDIKLKSIYEELIQILSKAFTDNNTRFLASGGGYNITDPADIQKLNDINTDKVQKLFL